MMSCANALLPTLLSLTGHLYFTGALMLGTIYCTCNFTVSQRRLRHSKFHSRRLLLVSVIYLPLLFFIMVVNKQ